MRQLPNIITLGNLFCGCIAISYILSSQPYIATFKEVDDYYITGTNQAFIASYFIFLAAIFDFFDGLVARWLKLESPIGKELDSLSDIVSFGVAPAMILYKMLWAAWMMNPDSNDLPIALLTPAFLLACFGAYRLAKFNSLPTNNNFFIGVPIPAVGLLVASFPLISFYNRYGVGAFLLNPWLLYALIAVLSWLMVSPLKFIAPKIDNANKSKMIPLLSILAFGLLSFLLVKELAIPLTFAFYLLCSLVIFKPQQS